jgi:Ca-activated chloride channel homolog
MPVDPHWLRPGWLWLLPLLALVIWLILRRQRQERRWEDLVDAPLRELVLTPGAGARPRVLLALVAVGWLLVAAALAGPAWQLASRPVFRIEHPRVLLLDLSASMQAQDIAPSRLARARFEVMDLLRGTDEGQFALIAFGAEPFLIAPLTTDAGTIVEQVPLLAPEVLPVTGERRTDLALDMAGVLLRRSAATGGDVLLVTDGVGALAETVAAAGALRAAGHRVSVLALSTHPDFAAVAAAGGGIVVASRADDLDTARLLALQDERRIDAAGRQVSVDRQWRDDGPWLLLLALPLAALAFRRGWLGVLPLALLLTPPPPVVASPWAELWLRPEQRALREAAAGELERALAGIDDPRWRAALRYRGGDYAGALDDLSGLTGAEAHYNRGNALARLGRYDAALAEYDAALALVPEHADAEHNRRLLLGLMREPESARLQGGADNDAMQGAEPGAGAAETGVGEAGQAGAEAGTSDPSALDGGGASAGSPGADGPAGAAPAPSVLPEASQQRDGAAATAADSAGSSGALGEPVGGRGLSGDTEDPGADAELPSADAVADGYLLQQVPDDPGRLLRERLMLQYLRRHGELH